MRLFEFVGCPNWLHTTPKYTQVTFSGIIIHYKAMPYPYNNKLYEAFPPPLFNCRFGDSTKNVSLCATLYPSVQECPESLHKALTRGLRRCNRSIIAAIPPAKKYSFHFLLTFNFPFTKCFI